MSIETNPQTTGRRGDDDFGTPPQSRVEQVLMNEQIKPQSRIEKLLLEGGGGGGGGGTSDYNQLNHKPSINGVQLVGNKTLSDLGIEWLWRGTRAQYEAVKASIPPNTFVDITDKPDIDTVPTRGSLNPVTSNGLWMELSKLKVINENPENHNGIYRGKDLTNVYTWDEIYARVHDGTFEDLYLGDYKTAHLVTDLYTRFTGSAFESGVTYYEMGGTVIARTWTETQDETPQSGKVYATKQVVEEDVDYMIAGFDLFLHSGDANSKVSDHHLIMIPRFEYQNQAAYNSIATDLSGYKGSDMHNITLPCYAKSTKAAINNHMLTHMLYLSSGIDASVPSNAGAGFMGASIQNAKELSEMSLMTELEAYGTRIMSSSYYDVGIDSQKFPIFNFVSVHENDGVIIKNSWLRDIAFVNPKGNVVVSVSFGYNLVNGNKMSNTIYVKPYFLFG